MKKSQRRKVSKLTRMAKRERLNDSTPRKVKRLNLEVAKLTVIKTELNRLCIEPRGNDAIKAYGDFGIVLARRAEQFNLGKAKY